LKRGDLGDEPGSPLLFLVAQASGLRRNPKATAGPQAGGLRHAEERTGVRHEYDCAECGLCCTNYGATLYFYEEDFARWREEDDENIRRRLPVMNEGGWASGWRSPQTGAEETRCPFLTTEAGYRCTIYPTRPLVCRHFANGGSACRELRAKHGLPVVEP
jgi:Fe-S-cluster containining protein